MAVGRRVSDVLVEATRMVEKLNGLHPSSFLLLVAMASNLIAMAFT